MKFVWYKSQGNQIEKKNVSFIFDYCEIHKINELTHMLVVRHMHLNNVGMSEIAACIKDNFIYKAHEKMDT